jgi:hypothetical protein
VALLYLGTAVGCLVSAVGLGLTIFGSGTVRVIGAGLLVAFIVLWAVPLSPILQARRRRRENGEARAPRVD